MYPDKPLDLSLIMKYLIFILLICAGRLSAQTTPATPTTPAYPYDQQPQHKDKNYAKDGKKIVYVCMTDGVYLYHISETCPVFKKCDHTESRIDLATARNQGFIPCKVCKAPK